MNNLLGKGRSDAATPTALAAAFTLASASRAATAELAQPTPNCRTRFVAFSSGADAVILPARNGQLDHPDLPTRNIVLPGMGHFTLADHLLVIDEICQLLAASPATQRHDARPIARASWPWHPADSN